MEYKNYDVKKYIKWCIDRNINTMEILERCYNKKPFTSWEGINLSDYINKLKGGLKE